MTTPNTFVVRTSADLGRALGELRRRRGQTQEQFAVANGITRASLAQFERGRLPRTLDLLLALLRRLGATVTITVEGSDGEA